MVRSRARVLVVEDDPHLADQLRWALQDGFAVESAGNRTAALGALSRWKPEVVLLDLCLPPSNTIEEGFQVLRAAREADPDSVAVVMSAAEEREAALRAISEGAYDFFQKPVDLDTLRVVLGRALERQALLRENRRLREQLRERFHIDGMVGVGPAMQRVFDAIRRVADSPVTVFLQGESGTGKELVARAIHFGGCRRDGPFVPVHCAALPRDLLEAELFGHERGSFTGAVASRVGRFEAADGGTLFLDELGCLDGHTQMKLLRVIEERTFERVGSNTRRPIDIRLIVATNEDLEDKVRRGEFRRDLFFRVHVFPIRLPPLRERPEDIPLLAEHFLMTLCAERRLPARRFAPETLRALVTRPWPGNVRELRNLVETLALLTDGETIEPASLPTSWLEAVPAAGGAAGETVGFKAAMRDFERRLLLEAIARAGGVRSRAARELGLDPSQMKYLTRKHGL